jgi:hypothetical protein
MKRVLIFVVTVSLFSGCAGLRPVSGLQSELVSAEYLKANLTYLASDEMEGRETAQRGERLAGQFIAAELEKYGVSVFPGSESWFQEVPLQVTRFSDSSFITIQDAAGEALTSLQYMTEFAGITRGAVAIDTTLPLVFAGYGIKADEYGYNDYSGMDVSGKAVLVFPGEPVSGDSSFFAGDKDTKYSGTRSKIATAREQGAAALLVVSSGEFEFGWERLRGFFAGDRLSLAGAPEKQPESNMAVIVLRSDALKKVLKGTRFSYQQIDSLASAEAEIPHFFLTRRARIHLPLDRDNSVTGRNVLGYIEGSDPALKNELVTMGAHYDHIGVSGGQVNNGADDNGSGTTALLEVARLFASQPAPKRSLLFAFYTGEEKGLLGSKYLAENFDDIDRVMVNINMDMVGGGATDSVYCIGSAKLSSELYDLVNETNDAGDGLVLNYKFDDPDDPNRLYYRSDHYNFAKQNVPVVFFFDYFMDYYHSPADDIGTINFEKLRRVTDLIYRVSKAAANRSQRFTLNMITEEN